MSKEQKDNSAIWFDPIIQSDPNNLKLLVEQVKELRIKTDKYDTDITTLKNDLLSLRHELLNIRDIRNKIDNELIDIKNDNLLLRHELLNIKDAILTLKEDLSKYKEKNAQILDERDKNKLIRSHVPFPFFPSK